MSFDVKLLIRAFSPVKIARAVSSLDKSTSVIVSTCWLAAFITMVLALVAVRGAVAYKKEAATAMAVDPVLPTISTALPTAREIEVLAERLQRQFPEVKITSKVGQIEIRSGDGNQFHQWITAISYLDTMAPQYRWTIRDFCTGLCPGQQLMNAVLTGQKIVLSMPNQQKKK